MPKQKPTLVMFDNDADPEDILSAMLSHLPGDSVTIDANPEGTNQYTGAGHVVKVKEGAPGARAGHYVSKMAPNQIHTQWHEQAHPNSMPLNNAHMTRLLNGGHAEYKGRQPK